VVFIVWRPFVFYALLNYKLHIGYLQVNKKSVEMLENVEKRKYRDPMKIGIGTKEHERALSGAGCERVFHPDDLEKTEHDSHDPAVAFFRSGDTVMMAQAGVLSMPRMRKVDAVGVSWQMLGHDPVRFTSDDERMAWRKTKARGAVIDAAPDVMGRPPKWPVPTQEQIKVIVGWWHTPNMKRALVIQSTQRLLGAEVPQHWVRDLVLKATGSAKRSPQGEGE
jgi:hypothetical protein